MSRKASEQALANLLPTLAESLPEELVELAAYLLAQSRSYGGSLKPEEEIARPYACAEIACKRLSKSLKLPPRTSRPPCPPRIYKKLFAYLEQLLSQSSTAAKRQEKDKVQPQPRRSTRERRGGPVTPSKTEAKSFVTPSKSTKTARIDKTTAIQSRLSTIIQDAPSWTMPTIRNICRALTASLSRLVPFAPPKVSTSFPPHIFAGLSSVLCFAERTLSDDSQGLDPNHIRLLSAVSDHSQPEETSYRENMITLIIAIYFLVIVRMLGLGRDENPHPGSSNRRELDMDMFNDLATAALASEGLTADQTLLDNVHVWVRTIIMRDWMNGNEWFENIPVADPDRGQGGAGAGNDESGGNLGDNDDEEDGIISPKKRRLMNRYVRKVTHRSLRDIDNQRPKLLPGLGTMMHDRVDWLSEGKKDEYVTWKEGTMKRIREIESAAVTA
ncbi:origin recognition complex subunit 6 [Coccidioides immitis RS]|uniref:Origin recognition complex subunit 6 n=3 Tax=Coccidioides immitis TaxID=5501 RepID=A0A0E1RW64_COCIM|nr:origin recognition complex subunit 6 [Coccidioides immitis RS]EAS28499.2 origin recognition complex subunit 6 [Coccidioides immitis RS]KMP02711.1 hypothetical protein CIRG_02403 [Coccidioides immitis RMSCC 2394]KMU89651.1 hypothetical protein CIHG_07458 [Coccidioides immitis H538.4]TPX23196.1 hypothetical protein DIZ76_012522 [Coccidioides immitis]